MASTHRRSRIELYTDILQAIANGRESPARMVYAANLSYDRVVKCLDFLEDQNLIQRCGGTEKRRYKVTSSGLNVVRTFGQVEAALYNNRKAVADIKIHYQ